MKPAKIKNINTQLFLEDLKRASEVMVHAPKTDSYFNITKKDLLASAETKHIDYFMSENVSSHGYIMIVR